MYDGSRYNFAMGKAISVRLDDEALRALTHLEATGLTRSEAIRKALKESSDLIRRRESLVEESLVLEADEADRREMLEVAEFMESLRGAG
jgi:predicted transcriptional regulator